MITEQNSVSPDRSIGSLKSELADAIDKIRQIEDKYNILFEHSDLGIFQTSLEGKLIQVNNAMAKMFGFSSPQDMLDSVSDFGKEVCCSSGDLQSLLCLLGERDYVENFRIEARKKNGEKFWVSVNAHTTRDRDGSVLYFEGTEIDITECVEAEKSQKMTEEQLRLILGVTSDGILLTDVNGKQTILSSNSIEMTGYTEEELSGRFVELMHPDDVGRVLQSFELVKNNPRKPFTVQYRHKHKQKGYVWLEATARNYLDHPSLKAVLVSVVNINERKIAEEKLIRSETQYRVLFEDAADSIFVSRPDTDKGAVILEANHKAALTFGYHRDDLANRPFLDLIAHSSRPFVLVHMSRLMAPGDSVYYETTSLRNNGVSFPVEVSSRMIRIGQDAPQIISIVRDVSERMRAENEVRKSLEEKKTLISELYHRTRNNMQVICSLIDLYAKKEKNGKQVESYKDIQHKIQTMSLVQMKLYQSQNLSSINLKEYIRDLASLLYESFGSGDGRITIDLENLQDVQIMIDSAVPCGLVLSELITNAFKHAFPGKHSGVITVNLRQDGDHMIRLKVSDNGVGVPPGHDLMKKRGLGIQIVFDIVEKQLQGKIEPTLKNGLTWDISFQDTLYNKRVDD